MIIRPAYGSDVAQIVASAIDFAADNYPNDVCDPKHIESVVWSMIGHDDAIAAIMETDTPDYAGCYLGCRIQNLLSGKFVSVEVLFWMQPRFRGHGGKMRSYVESWAKMRECGTVVLSCPDHAERAGQTFMSWGYRPCERHYRKDLN